jgi:hypothetical protein
VSDVFVRDLLTNTTTLASISKQGLSGNQASDQPSLTDDGRFVAFRSFASNLVGGDTNRVADIFVRDLVSETTTRVSVATDGTEANGESTQPFLSAHGSVVVFTSAASNIVAPFNGDYDAFVHNMRTGRTAFAGQGVGRSLCSGTTIQYRSAVAVSANRRHIALTAFCYGALYLYDRVRATGATRLVGETNTGAGIGGSFSSVRYSRNGSTIAWVFNTASDGAEVDFVNTATGARDYFDPPQTGVYPEGLGLSRDAARIAYVGGNGYGDTHTFSAAVGQPKVYSYDRADRTLRYISVPRAGAAAEADGPCGGAALSSDGTTVAFDCNASDIVPGDNNGTSDVFARPVADSPVPNLQAILSTADVSITEPASGSTDATITVTLDRPPQFSTEISVYYSDITATSPADYDGTSTLLYFSPGQTTGTTEVPIFADAKTEGDETFAVTTHVDYGDVALGPHANAIVTIHDRA